MAAIAVKLKRGLAGCPRDHRLVVWGMGLKKFGSEKILPDNQSTLGMINKVAYLVDWKRVDAAAPKGRNKR